MQADRKTAASAFLGIGRRPALLPAAGVLAVLLGLGTVARAAPTQVISADDTAIDSGDLVRLATSFADAVGELKVAQLRVEALTSLQETTVVSAVEIRIAKISVQTAQQKVDIIRAIVQREQADAEAKLETLKRLEQALTKSSPAVADTTEKTKPGIARLEATLRVLQMILDIQ